MPVWEPYRGVKKWTEVPIPMDLIGNPRGCNKFPRLPAIMEWPDARLEDATQNQSIGNVQEVVGLFMGEGGSTGLWEAAGASGAWPLLAAKIIDKIQVEDLTSLRRFRGALTDGVIDAMPSPELKDLVRRLLGDWAVFECPRRATTYKADFASMVDVASGISRQGLQPGQSIWDQSYIGISWQVNNNISKMLHDSACWPEYTRQGTWAGAMAMMDILVGMSFAYRPPSPSIIESLASGPGILLAGLGAGTIATVTGATDADYSIFRNADRRQATRRTRPSGVRRRRSRSR